MSSISSTTSGSSALAAYYQKLQANSSSTTSSTDSTDATTTAPPHRGHGGGGGRMDAALEKQGITGTSLSDLRSKIKDAVDSAKSDPSTANDPDAIKNAVDGVLSSAGVNMDELHSDMDADQSSDDSSTTASDATPSLSSILSTYGIDADSFKTNLQSLLGDTSSSGDDFSSLFSGASLGSGLDVVG